MVTITNQTAEEVMKTAAFENKEAEGGVSSQTNGAIVLHNSHKHTMRASIFCSPDRSTPGSQAQNWRISNSVQEVSQYGQCSLYESLKTLFFSLKLCGLHHYKSPKKAGKYECWTSRIYPSAVLIILWVNLIRQLTTFNKEDTFGPQLFTKLIYMTWTVLCTINASSVSIAVNM